jgi:hypothetical protein
LFSLRLCFEFNLASLWWGLSRTATSLYLGYDPIAGPLGVLVGSIYSLIAGAVAGALFGWLYNSFVEKF